MAERDLYADLGLKKGASKEEIKKAYRKLARELHPDRNPDNPAAEERFKRVAYAKDVLADDRKRGLYDEFGEIGLREGFDVEAARAMRGRARVGSAPQGFGFEEIFSGARGAQGRRSGFGSTLEDLFGGGIDDLFGRGGPVRGGRPGPGGAARAGRVPDQESEITVSFHDALFGAEKELTIREGSEQRTIRVRIPQGVRDGEKVRLRGQGGAVPGLERGDLILAVKVAPHRFLRRDGDDLHLDLPVTVLEAWKGATVRVPTLQGEVNLKVPARVQTGAKLRLKGKGIPKRGGGTGDMFVHLQVRMPDGHDHSRIESALKELEEQYLGDVRAGIEL